MIVKIILQTEKEILIMMFGNSYENWRDQFREFAVRYKVKEVLSVYSAPNKWIGWGGLKWCEEKDFQNQLNREGCQQDDPDNPNPRIYSEMCFNYNPIAFFTASKIVRHLNKKN